MSPKQTQPPELTDEQLQAAIKARGWNVQTEQQGLTLEQKMTELGQVLGTFQAREGMTSEQVEMLENQYNQQLENRLLRTERSLRAKHPNATDDQVCRQQRQ